ncbi:MAG: (Fe-S)-binding protein [Acidobacteriota bacterium]|jgi:Fe-S oxidoreductase
MSAAATPTPLKQAMVDNRGLWCLECGKCTANCPIARHNGGYSPRRIMGMALTGDDGPLTSDVSQWSCLACGMCEPRCPANVSFSNLLQRVRAETLPEKKSWPSCTHGGTLHALMRKMGEPEMKQDRLHWLDDDLEVAEEGEVLLFVGCAPYYSAYFQYLDADILDSTRSAIKILNHVGIKPVLLSDERCCGHDLLWVGDNDNYRKLGTLNVEAITASGAKKVVTTCAECYRTLKLDYPRDFGRQSWSVQHISEFIAEKVDAGEIAFNGSGTKGTVTYQDPCRLGRHSGVYDEPRTVLDNIPDVELVEMERNREGSLCCGTSSWINCDITSKQIQAARLTSAKKTGAQTLVTSCPKCRIHFKCALQDGLLAKTAAIEIKDLAVVAAEALQEG